MMGAYKQGCVRPLSFLKYIRALLQMLMKVVARVSPPYLRGLEGSKLELALIGPLDLIARQHIADRRLHRPQTRAAHALVESIVEAIPPLILEALKGKIHRKAIRALIKRQLKTTGELSVWNLMAKRTLMPRLLPLLPGWTNLCGVSTQWLQSVWLASGYYVSQRPFRSSSGLRGLLLVLECRSWDLSAFL